MRMSASLVVRLVNGKQPSVFLGSTPTRTTHYDDIFRGCERGGQSRNSRQQIVYSKKFVYFIPLNGSYWIRRRLVRRFPLSRIRNPIQFCFSREERASSSLQVMLEQKNRKGTERVNKYMGRCQFTHMPCPLRRTFRLGCSFIPFEKERQQPQLPGVLYSPWECLYTMQQVLVVVLFVAYSTVRVMLGREEGRPQSSPSMSRGESHMGYMNAFVNKLSNTCGCRVNRVTITLGQNSLSFFLN